MKYLGSKMLAVSLGAVVITGSVGCAQNGQNTAGGGAAQQTGEQTTGSTPGGSMGSMMEHMQQVRGRFQNMGEETYWTQGGSAIPGSQHMMALSGDLATMADAMRGAMDQVQSLNQSAEKQSALSGHIDQMQRHMQAMSTELDAMAEIMPGLREGEVEGQSAGQMGSMGSMGSMMEHMMQMRLRFQDMGKESYWMHGGGVMPGSQHMMTLSGDLATMADAMRGAMDQMQSLMEQSGGQQSAYSRHLQQMQQHMQAMSSQLDQMSRAMENLHRGVDN